MVEKIVKKNDFCVTTETQLYDIITNVLYQLSKHEDPSITKDSLKFNQDILKETIERLDIKKNKTTMFQEYARTVYIKVAETSTNTSSTKVEINIARQDSKFIHLTLIIPPNFSSNVGIKPVMVAISNATRELIPEIDVKFIEVTRESSHGVKEYYYVVDLKVDNFVLMGTQSVEVTNELARTTAYSNILFNEDPADITVNEIKTTSIKTPPVIEFDDIPDRNKLVRSNSISNYEIISRDEYQALEAASAIDPRTVYSIPEDYQDPNPDRDKILTIKINGTGTVDITTILKSFSKVMFNGEVVTAIPDNTVGTIEFFDAVANDVYSTSNSFGTIPGVVEWYGDLDGVNTTTTSYMFNDMPDLTFVNINKVVADSITDVSNMFTAIPNVSYIDLSTLKLVDVTNFSNFINPKSSTEESSLTTINMNNIILANEDINIYNGMFGLLANIADVHLNNVDAHTIDMICRQLNNARTSTPETKIRVRVDSPTVVDGLTFSNIEFIY